MPFLKHKCKYTLIFSQNLQPIATLFRTSRSSLLPLSSHYSINVKRERSQKFESFNNCLPVQWGTNNTGIAIDGAVMQVRSVVIGWVCLNSNAKGCQLHAYFCFNRFLVQRANRQHISITMIKLAVQIKNKNFDLVVSHHMFSQA